MATLCALRDAIINDYLVFEEDEEIPPPRLERLWGVFQQYSAEFENEILMLASYILDKDLTRDQEIEADRYGSDIDASYSLETITHASAEQLPTAATSLTEMWAYKTACLRSFTTIFDAPTVATSQTKAWEGVATLMEAMLPPKWYRKMPAPTGGSLRKNIVRTYQQTWKEYASGTNMIRWPALSHLLPKNVKAEWRIKKTTIRKIYGDSWKRFDEKGDRTETWVSLQYDLPSEVARALNAEYGIHDCYERQWGMVRNVMNSAKRQKGVSPADLHGRLLHLNSWLEVQHVMGEAAELNEKLGLCPDLATHFEVISVLPKGLSPGARQGPQE
jgi:hypothetical protein